MRNERLYGEPPSLTADQGVVLSQRGWSLFSVPDGTLLLTPMAFDGQVVLVDGQRRVRWAFGVRGKNANTDITYEYVVRCALRPGGPAAPGGGPPTAGYTELVCELAAQAGASVTYWVRIPLPDILCAAHRGEEKLAAESRIEAPIGSLTFLAWSPASEATSNVQDFGPAAAPAAAAVADVPSPAPSHDF